MVVMLISLCYGMEGVVKVVWEWFNCTQVATNIGVQQRSVELLDRR